jgi:excisionase family DNA binding protein
MVTHHKPSNDVSEIEKITNDAIIESPLMTVQEVARYLQVTPSTVRAMAKRGKLPAIKIGRIWRFKFSSLQIMLKEIDIPDK